MGVSFIPARDIHLIFGTYQNTFNSLLTLNKFEKFSYLMEVEYAAENKSKLYTIYCQFSSFWDVHRIKY